MSKDKSIIERRYEAKADTFYTSNEWDRAVGWGAVADDRNKELDPNAAANVETLRKVGQKVSAAQARGPVAPT